MQLNLNQHRARRAELLADQGRLQEQRTAQLDAGNLEVLKHLDRQLAVINDDLALHSEYIASAAQKAAHPVRAQRRAEARELAADAQALVDQLPALAAAADAAADQFIDAMNALLGAWREAANIASNAAGLACEGQPWHQRLRFDQLDPGSGAFPVAAVMALRDALSGMDSPHHVYRPAPGLQFGPEDRMPFAKAIEWVTNRTNVCTSVERECAAEEALAAELQAFKAETVAV